jgi:hypothetical protein
MRPRRAAPANHLSTQGRVALKDFPRPRASGEHIGNQVHGNPGPLEHGRSAHDFRVARHQLTHASPLVRVGLPVHSLANAGALRLALSLSLSNRHVRPNLAACRPAPTPAGALADAVGSREFGLGHLHPLANCLDVDRLRPDLLHLNLAPLVRQYQLSFPRSDPCQSLSSSRRLSWALYCATFRFA